MSTYTESKVVVSAQIEREQRKELERIALEQGRTNSYLVRRAVDQYLRGDMEGERA
jgi:predicted DNA-binding protein